MLLLVGLGNPGPRYAGNRHNIGFMAVDDIVRRRGFSPWRARFQGLVAEGQLAGERMLALKPQTYMNEFGPRRGRGACASTSCRSSGSSCSTTRSTWRPARCGSSAAAAPPATTVCAHRRPCGPDYWRVRLGIGHPGQKELVLHCAARFRARGARRTAGCPALDAVADAAPLLVEGDRKADERFMTRVAHLAPPPKTSGRQS